MACPWLLQQLYELGPYSPWLNGYKAQEPPNGWKMRVNVSEDRTSALSDDDVDKFVSAHMSGVPWVEFRSCRWGMTSMRKVWNLLLEFGMTRLWDWKNVEAVLQDLRAQDPRAEELNRLKGVKAAVEKCVSIYESGQKRSPNGRIKLMLPVLNEAKFHFYLYVLQVSDRGFELTRYDSMGSLGNASCREDCATELLRWLCSRVYPAAEFLYTEAVKAVAQGHDLSCGAFTCAYALLDALDLGALHTQLDHQNVRDVYALIENFFRACETSIRNSTVKSGVVGFDANDQPMRILHTQHGECIDLT